MNPEIILWTRVLLQAIWDLAGIRVNAPPRDIPRLRSSARAWICSADHSQGSFIWTCNSLSLDPDTVRKRGLRVDAEADQYTIPGLVEVVTNLLMADPAKRGE